VQGCVEITQLALTTNDANSEINQIDMHEPSTLKHDITDTQWVSFYLGEELFACPIQTIQEIIPYQEPIPVPGASHAVEGVLNVRGEIIPVVCGTELTGLPQKPSQDKHKEDSGNIIILESTLGLLGMTIDSVSEIIHIEPEEINYEVHETSSINGSALHDGQLIILLDIKPEILCSQDMSA